MEVDEAKFANECRIGMKWRIKEENLKDKQEGYLKSKIFKANIPGVNYHLRLFPLVRNKSQRNHVKAYLYVDFEMSTQITADFTISVKSASKIFKHVSTRADYIYTGGLLCTHEDAFDPEKKFFIDGIMELELEGTLKSQGIKRKAAEPLSLAKWLRTNNDEEKDITMAVGDEEIKIHKWILSACSPVFNAELNSEFKESKEKKIVVTDFCFETVKNAVLFCYEDKIDDYDDFEETSLELLHFADKYDMKKLHEYLQTKLIEMMSEDTVVQFANASITSNSDDLREFCVCFLIKAAKESKIIVDFDELKDEIKMEITQRLFLSGSK